MDEMCALPPEDPEFETLRAAFPDELRAAAALARVQRDALAALELDMSDEP